MGRMRRRSVRAVVSLALVAGVSTVLARLLGYRLGLRTVVRCRRGHLFETIWIPGVKLKGLDLGVARVQRCPVGKHWTVVVPVKAASLSEEDRKSAAQHRDVRIP
jgi:hypothetical protein